MGQEGYATWFDVSVPRSPMDARRRGIRQLLRERHPGWLAVDLGHYGDGGLHAGVVWPFNLGEPASADLASLRRGVYGLVEELGGSFSAEHGIGPYNADCYHERAPEVLQELSGQLKQLLDPRGVLGVTSLGPVSPRALDFSN